ncbi:unnamed protein product [Musa acuminata subsp. burmannicoides]
MTQTLCRVIDSATDPSELQNKGRPVLSLTQAKPAVETERGKETKRERVCSSALRSAGIRRGRCLSSIQVALRKRKKKERLLPFYEQRRQQPPVSHLVWTLVSVRQAGSTGNGIEEETSEVYISEIEYEGNGEKAATVVLLLVSSTKKTTVSFSYLRCFSVAFPLFNFLVSLSPPLYHPTMAALVPDSTNNSSSSNKLDVDGLSCSSAISGGASDNTTYVRADPDNFRALVQRLTGASAATDNYSVRRLPSEARKVESKKRKLQDRRPVPTKLEININPSLYSTSATCYHRQRHYHRFSCTGSWSKGHEAGLLTSPISTMDSILLVSSASPTAATPAGAAVLLVKKEEEERAIAEKGFYLHPSPRSNSGEPPKLLQLFPLHSPKNSSVSTSE